MRKPLKKTLELAREKSKTVQRKSIIKTLRADIYTTSIYQADFAIHFLVRLKSILYLHLQHLAEALIQIAQVLRIQYYQA